MEQEKLIQGCKNGNKKCQEYLVRTYAPRLLAICKRYTKEAESANDALQETFVNVFKYIHSYSGKGSFEGWIKRIAVNCSITFQKKYFNNFHEGEVEQDIMYSKIPEVYSNIGSDEIMGLLSQLPDSLYVVFNMSVIEGFNHKEISEALGISEGTSRASLSRARAKLIGILKQRERAENTRIENIRIKFNPGIYSPWVKKNIL